MRYSLRQLEVFLATAACENITRAAASLAMSQSAASSSLKDLETQFNVKLFDRVGKRIQLSELGNQVRPQAENLLAQARAFEQALTGDEVTGRLQIGAGYRLERRQYSDHCRASRQFRTGHGAYRG